MPESFQLASEDIARAYDMCTPIFMDPFIESALAAADIANLTSLLDVACGPGSVTRKALRHVPDLQVSGCDMNDAMIAVAKQNVTTGDWRVASAQDMPFEDNSHDAAVCQQGMQFFPDAAAAAREMVRIVKPGGRIVATAWAPLDVNPYFAAQADALEKFIDTKASESVRFALRRGVDTYLGDAFTAAGLAADISLVEHTATIPDIAAYAGRQIVSTPWAGVFMQSAADDQRAFCDSFAESLMPMTNEGVATVPFTSWLAVATAAS